MIEVELGIGHLPERMVPEIFHPCCRLTRGRDRDSIPTDASGRLGRRRRGHALMVVLLYLAAGVAALVVVNVLVGGPVPFLRWSFIRMLFGMKRLLSEWQVGDGREQAAASYVVANAPAGSIDAAIAAIDRFAYRHKFLINVGDEKGAILDAAVERVRPQRVLELGAYVGYSALRMARRLPAGGHVFSVEFNPSNAAIARQIIDHAGAADHITIVVGSIGDGGKTVAALEAQHGFQSGGLDLAFIDHTKEAYLPDLQRILEAGWLHPGSVVVADNVGFPGAPEYKAYMEAEEGKRWHTRAHKTHVEYQKLIADLVLESTLV
jgi:catechol O-methyltransferase